MKPTTVASWIGSLAVAGLFGFTGLFKLSGHPDAQATFSAIGGAPVMYFTGVIEVIGAVLILLPKTRAYGAVLAVGVMAGAIVSHVASLVPNDNMLPMAVGLFVAAAAVAWLHRRELPVVGKLACCSANPIEHAEPAEA